MTNDEIAKSLAVSPNTIRFHLKDIYSKLGIESRTQLTRAVLLGAIELSAGEQQRDAAFAISHRNLSARPKATVDERAARGLEATGSGACFIVGTGRCGSTLLSNVVRLHPDLLSLSELFTVLGREQAFPPGSVGGEEFWRMLSTPRADALNLINSGVTIPEILYSASTVRDVRKGVPPLLLVTLPHLTDDYERLFDDVHRLVLSHSNAPVARHYNDLFTWLCGRFGKIRWIERSGGSLAYIDQVLLLWPNEKVVHVWRDGADCAISMSKHPFFQSLVSAVRPSARTGTADGRAAPLQLFHFGIYWSLLIRHGVAALDQLPPGRVLTIRYETLLSSPRTELLRFVEFLCPGSASRAFLNEAVRLVRLPARSRVDVPRSEWERLELACRPGRRILSRMTA